MLIVPDTIADLAQRSRYPVDPVYSGDSYSPSLNRSVLADWLEEQEGHRGLAFFLRPRPVGFEEEAWAAERKRVIELILTSHKMRDSLLAFQKRNR